MEIELIITIIGLIISEIMPLLPNKYNGIIQGIIAVIAKRKQNVDN